MNIELADFLAADGRPEGTMNYAELHGFLFALACSPEPLKPAEWQPMIFNGEDASFTSQQESEAVMAAIMAIHDETARQVQQEAVALPQFCSLAEIPMDNFADDAPIGHWARGFLHGHDWLSEVWDAYIPEEMSAELGSCLIVLTFFAERKLAQEYCKESEATLETMAESATDHLESAMRSYASMGRAIQLALGPRTPYVREQKIGRNDPCPCGSGKKYKQCCMKSQ